MIEIELQPDDMNNFKDWMYDLSNCPDYESYFYEAKEYLEHNDFMSFIELAQKLIVDYSEIGQTASFVSAFRRYEAIIRVLGNIFGFQTMLDTFHDIVPTRLFRAVEFKTKFAIMLPETVTYLNSYSFFSSSFVAIWIPKTLEITDLNLADNFGNTHLVFEIDTEEARKFAERNYDYECEFGVSKDQFKNKYKNELAR